MREADFQRAGRRITFEKILINFNLTRRLIIIIIIFSNYLAAVSGDLYLYVISTKVVGNYLLG